MARSGKHRQVFLQLRVDSHEVLPEELSLINM